MITQAPTRWLILPTIMAVALCAVQLAAQEKLLRTVIDSEISAAWMREKFTPADPATDAEFLRRVYLDLVGVIPTADEAAVFLDDTATDKRSKLIDKLLDDPRFAEQQANHWDLLFFGRRPADQELTSRREGFQKWLKGKFATNEPYDRWARDLLLAQGGTYEGPAMFFAQFRSRPEDAAEAVSRLFLGTQIHCARCHDHPFDKWTQTDFYGVAGFFARLTFIDAKEDGKRHYILAEKSSGEVLFTGPAAKQTPGQKGEPVAPRFLGGEDLQEPHLPEGFKEPDLKGVKDPPKPLFSRREKFVDWATRPENPYFTKAIVNRVWAQFLGRGIIDPVDDLRESHVASLPGVFQTLQKELVAHQYDLKWLIRELVHTQAYQLSSAGSGTDALPKWYERARVRPLTAEEIMAAIRQATNFDESVRAAGAKPETTALPERNYFLSSFGEPFNGRGEFQPNLNEHLFFNNSGTLRQSLIQMKKGNLADSLNNSTAPWEERVDHLFLAILSRRPLEVERKKFVEYLSAEKASAPAVEEAIWVLLNTSEFRFNH
ncbi:hypothetical protein ETAA8_41370 [Anatilimnocola aggregata]|uniref:DUF1549 domain-containing protein n=1 Tax=Anatilimnocola aggregata TaxID=2528021 RepID=A0A517YFM2_9BACT|nr:DUF1549 domain-containing protein [Anatilimnocola aggregata]QDU29030.1 hypothetical protein ETAA8_41370 [Anatilimnocola aggregata]